MKDVLFRFCMYKHVWIKWTVKFQNEYVLAKDEAANSDPKGKNTIVKRSSRRPKLCFSTVRKKVQEKVCFPVSVSLFLADLWKTFTIFRHSEPHSRICYEYLIH